MHYDPRSEPHGLSHNPFYSAVVPRPIGWITTLSRDGVVNLAPYSFFNAVAGSPPFVIFASGPRKDSQRNAEEMGEFVCNMATYDLRAEMNASSAKVPPDVSEPELIGLEMVPSILVAPPRVKRSPVTLECRYRQTVNLVTGEGETLSDAIVIGEVVQIHIDDAVITNGRIDLTKIRPIARLGYMDYTVVETIFEMKRPS
jgi:flavin reductase (DIM6/NTAB) family NADH-FMN oxidoreductase RutF